MGMVESQETKRSNDLSRPTPTPTFPPTSSTPVLAPPSSLASPPPNSHPPASWALKPPCRRSDYDSTSASSPSSHSPARSTGAASAEKISTTAVLAGVLGSFGFFVLVGILFIFWKKRKLAAERAERRRNRAQRKAKGGSGGQDGVQGPGRTKEVKEIAEMARMHEEPTNLRPSIPGYTTPNASSQTKQKSQAIQQDLREQHGTRQGETSSLTRPTPAQRSQRNGSDFNQPPSQGMSGTRILGVPSSSPALQAMPGEPKITSGKRILAVANDTTPSPNGRPQPQGMTPEDAPAHPSGSPRRNALPRLRESQEEERPGTPVPLHPPLREFYSNGSGRGSPASGRLRQPRRRLASAAGDTTASDSEYFSDASIGTRQTLMSTISASRAARNNSARGVPVQQQVVLDLPPAYTPD
ncbi:hypothetical protein DFP72DRAFT_873047 [Ephemerocybe angulata]|uniref:Uncharacterized protein n=1 Tax=Ephemerocybe angulata TaxID=980116 RepID=A0A8H6MC02_9AGAR|nr:hypothetical protein DFP72DRAFT_873047 [Tulosesus angulatus]